MLANLIPSSKEEKTSYYRCVLAWHENESDNNIAASTPTCKRKMSDAFDEDDIYDDNSPHEDDINSTRVNNNPPKSSVENIQMNELIGDVQKLNIKPKMIDSKLDRILENQKQIMAKLGVSEQDNEIKMCLIQAMLMPSIKRNLIKAGPSTENTKCWEVKLCPDTPQQMDSDSCGILCIKMLECLCCGRSIGQIDPEMSDLYRKKYCFELF